MKGEAEGQEKTWDKVRMPGRAARVTGDSHRLQEQTHMLCHHHSLGTSVESRTLGGGCSIKGR